MALFGHSANYLLNLLLGAGDTDMDKTDDRPCSGETCSRKHAEGDGEKHDQHKTDNKQ